MIRTFLFLLVIGFSFSCIGSDGQYTLIIEGHDWGPAVNKVILPMGRKLSSPDGLRFNVEVFRETECEELNPEAAMGERRVTGVYVSDPKGNPVAEGNHITLELEVSPDLVLSNPFHSQNNYLQTRQPCCLLQKPEYGSLCDPETTCHG